MRVQVMVTHVQVREGRIAALVECSACGPVGVDTVVVNAMLLGTRHLFDSHRLGGVKV